MYYENGESGQVIILVVDYCAIANNQSTKLMSQGPQDIQSALKILDKCIKIIDMYDSKINPFT